jgi:hypothetical protein
MIRYPVIQPTAGYVYITPTNTSADAVNINAALAQGGVVQLGPGTFQAGNSVLLAALSGTWLRGSGIGVTTLKLPPSSPFTDYIFRMFGPGGGPLTDMAITDLTIDGQNNTGGSSASVFANNVTNLTIRNIEIINMYSMFGIVVQGATNFSVSDNRVTLPTPRQTQNNAILGTVNVQNSNGIVANNVLVGSGMEFEGEYIDFVGNKISGGFQYGSGIASGPSAVSHDNTYTNNHIHDSGVLADSDGDYPTGLEIWAYNSVVSNNIVSKTADNGIFIGGQNDTVTGNIVYDCVQSTVRQGQGHGGIFVDYNGSAAYQNGSNATIEGNISFNSNGNAGSQPYALVVFGSSLTGVTVGTNNFGVGSSGTISGTNFTSAALFSGTGNPSFSAPQGSIYTRVDASTAATRVWVNTNGSTGWTFFTANA